MHLEQVSQLPVVVIACGVFQGILEKSLTPEQARRIRFLDSGLHTWPKKLNTTIQQAIDSIEEPSFIFLGYGLCGNGLHNIKSGIHTLAIPKADDCISMFLGSQEKYYEEFHANPATYYLTKGWLESGDTPLHEYRRTAEKYGEEKALWIMDQQYKHYKRLAFVAHTQADLEKYRTHALEVAHFCERWGMVYKEILGSENFIQRIVDVIQDPSRLADDFVLISSESVSNKNDFRYQP